MANFHSGSAQKRNSRSANTNIETYQREQLEQYRAFMTGYVKRINESTFNVDIGGIKIGSAKYTRLAQINLKSRIITFSRYAIENVPERGRRYLVLHELAHVKEASHNKRFWALVAKYEPDYRQIGKSLEKAFLQNVKGENKVIQTAFSLNQAKHTDLSSERFQDPGLLSRDTDLSYGIDLLDLIAEEQENYESIHTRYNDEAEHFIDWIC